MENINAKSNSFFALGNCLRGVAFLFVLGCGFFFTGNNAMASDTSDFSNISGTVYRTTVSGENWIQKMYNGKNNVSKIDLRFTGKNPEMAVVFYICSGDPSGIVADDFNCSAGTSTILWESGPVTIASSTDSYSLTLPLPVATDGPWYLSIAHPTYPIYMGVNVANYSTCDLSGTGELITLNAYPGNPGCSPFYFRTYLNRQTYYNADISTDLTVELISPADDAQVGLYSPIFRGRYRDDGHLASDIVLVINNLTTGASSTQAFSLADVEHSSTTKTFGTFVDDVATPMGYSTQGTSTWTAYLRAGSVQISLAPPVNTFVIGTSTFVLDAMIPDALSVFGTSSRAMVCSDDEWNSTSTYLGMNFTVIKCSVFQTTFDVAQKVSAVPTSLAQGFIGTLSNIFPLSLFVQIKTTWDDSATAVLPDNLSWLEIGDAEQNVYLPLPSLWYGSTSPMLVWGPAITSGNSALIAGVAGFRVFTTLGLWYLFIMQLYYLAVNVTEDFNDD